jgi:hypothetical protein
MVFGTFHGMGEKEAWYLVSLMEERAFKNLREFHDNYSCADDNLLTKALQGDSK